MDFHRRYPDRIKLLLRERNIGQERNFESTLSVCHGQYVAILEGDDYWTRTDKLQKQVNFLDAHPDRALCCHRALWLNETNPAESFVTPNRNAGPHTIEDLLKENFVVTCSAVLRRDLIEPLPPPFFVTRVGDWPRFAAVAQHGKIELMDDVMAVYRVHPESTFSSRPLLERYENCTQMLKILDEYLGFKYTNTIRQTLAGFYFNMASIVRQQGRRKDTARHVISCIRNGGWRTGKRRFLVGLGAYALIGSRYKMFSRAILAKSS
jgi:hypothetical protein